MNKFLIILRGLEAPAIKDIRDAVRFEVPLKAEVSRRVEG